MHEVLTAPQRPGGDHDRTGEAVIAKPYDRSIDRAMGAHKGRSRLVAAAILAVGLMVVMALYVAQGSRRITEAAAAVRVGDDSAAVLVGLGVPGVRCAPGSLAHVREALPPGTPRPLADETIDRLRRETRTRWVWGDEAACSPRSGSAEIGLGADGRVLWVVPEHGAETARLP